MNRWREFGTVIRALREAAGITQEQLAEQSGVVLDTVRSYEQGRRRPGSTNLARLAEVIGAEQQQREKLYAAAGREAPASLTFRTFLLGRAEPQGIAQQLAGQRWVSLVTNERHGIVGWNELANRVAEIDMAAALPTNPDRNLVWMACRPHFLRRLTNWDELIGRLMWFLREEGVGLDQQPGPGIPPYFMALVARLGRESNQALERLYRLWFAMPKLVNGTRNLHPVEWTLAGGTHLKFHAVFRDWSLYDGLFAFDWMAADRATSRWVESQLQDAGQAAWAPIGSPVAPEEFPELLEETRLAGGLSRKKLAQAAALAPSSIYAYERGLHRPPREVLLALARAMSADGMTTNRLLEALQYEHEPSPHARWMAGDMVTPSGGLRAQPGGRTPEQLRDELNSLPWPCFMVNNQCQVEAVNPAADHVTGFTTWAGQDSAPHLLRFLLSPMARERAVNWPELTRAVLPDTLRLQIPEMPDPKPIGPFRREVESIRRTDAASLRALLEAWNSASVARVAPIRVAVPIQWTTNAGAVAEFHCFVVRWNARDPYWAIDWHPANDAAWDAIGAP